MSPTNSIPVIAIDGPSASGKGTIAERVANELNFNYLDSGALYRLVALAALNANIDLNNEKELSRLARDLNAHFGGNKVYLAENDVSLQIRSESCSKAASQVAVWPLVRQALLSRQREFRKAPGLVAEGRDMGSVVFPDASPKVYLTAGIEARAQRRYKQLKEKGIDAKLPDLLQDLRERDARDSERGIAPLQKCADASMLDTTFLTIDDVVAQVVALYSKGSKGSDY